MRTAFAMLAGGAIGALAIQGLQAQQTPGAQQQLPKIIYVAEIDISDQAAYAKDYAPKVLPMIKQFGGTFLAVGGTGGGFPNMTQLTGFDGQPPKIAVLQGWDSVEKITAWHTNPEYLELRKNVGDKVAKFRSFAIELPQQR